MSRRTAATTAPAPIAVAVASVLTALDDVTKSTGSLTDSVKKGVAAHGLATFGNAVLDKIRGDSLRSEKEMRANDAAAFSRYTLAVRVLKSCADDGWALKVSAKSGEGTVCTVTEKEAAAPKAKAKASSAADTGAADGNPDGMTGEVRLANFSESFAAIVAQAGDAAILEGLALLAAKDKSAAARLIAAGMAFATANGLSDAVTAQVGGMGKLLKAA